MALAAAGGSFPVRPPEEPLALSLSAPPLNNWGQTPVLRLIYYILPGQAFNDLDRRTILRELKLIQDFYAHYGLKVRLEDKVHEVQGSAPKDLPLEQYDYRYIKKNLERAKLLVPRRTIVFTVFDVGLGAEMALTGLNDHNTRRHECPRPRLGKEEVPWWCGRPEAAHWGGSVHEVGHMLGLAHPKDYTEQAPYLFADGSGSYVFTPEEAPFSVMVRHDRFFRHPDNGLRPHDVDLLYRAFHAPGAPSPGRCLP